MSVFDGLGAAAAIMQFIGYSIKFSNKAIATYKGHPELAGVKVETDELQTSTNALIDNLNLRSTGPDSGEAVLIRIAEDCQHHAGELIRIIDSVGVMKPEKRSFWDALKTTSKSQMKKNEIGEKQKALRQARFRCQEQLLLMISDRQYALADALNRVERRQARHESDRTQGLARLKKELLDAISSSNAHAVMEISRATHKLVKIDLPQENILSSLGFSDMSNRHDRIEEPGYSTYQWVFDNTNLALSGTRYLPWLENGDGIFWITGKAGSGKSTLMKYICDDSRTRKALQSWANGRKLFIASHYFWYLGSPMEKSFSGLLRSILYKVLHNCPDIIESVCETRWSEELRGRDSGSTPWTDTELRRCLEMLIASDLKFEAQNICFCFFIDGLDEFDGDYEVVETLVRLARSIHVKICASSRPWNKFDVAFDASKRQGNYLELHLHTKDDVAKFVRGELKDTLINVGKVNGDLEPVISEVISRSEGVFLWVSLVIRKELRPMLEAEEDIASLRERLDAIPGDLNDYFQRIFERMWADTKFRRHTARIFKSCIAASQPLPIDIMNVMISDFPDKIAMSANFEEKYEWDERNKVRTIRKSVNLRCQDLLSVVSPSESQAKRKYYRIEFLHRSVKDYVDQFDEVSQKLDQYAGSEFDVDFTLLGCYAFLLTKAFSIGHYPFFVDLGVPVSIQWCTEALLHMRKTSHSASTTGLLHVLDESMTHLFSRGESTHWSNEVCALQVRMPRNFAERGFRNLTGHLIEFGLADQVIEILATNPSALSTKPGRPYLDYALRYDTNAPFRSNDTPAVPWSSLSGDFAMVQALLDRGCDVNEKIYMYEGRTVWDLYLAFLYDNDLGKERYRKLTWLLIGHGARPISNCVVGEQKHERTAKYRDTVIHNTKLSMVQILTKAFGGSEAEAMCEAIAKNGRASSWWFSRFF